MKHSSSNHYSPPAEHDWQEIICRGIESDTLDYKAALDWKLLPRHMKAKFVRHCIAFANTHGGMIVVGVSEDDSGRPVVRTGLTSAEAAGFDPSAVGAFINSYADPPIDMVIHRPEVDGKIFAVIEVRPFESLPHVCSKGISDELNAGVLYIRTADASSRPAYRSGEIHNLLIRALRLQREQLGRLLKGLLAGTDAADIQSPGDRFAEQALHGRNFFRRCKGTAPEGFIFAELCIRPEGFENKRFSVNELRASMRNIPGHGEWYSTNTALRYCAGDGSAFGQISRSGLYQHIRRIEASREAVCAFVRKAAVRGSAAFAGLGMEQELLGFAVRLYPASWRENANISLKSGSGSGDFIYDVSEMSPVTLWHKGSEWQHSAEIFADDLTKTLFEELKANII